MVITETFSIQNALGSFLLWVAILLLFNMVVPSLVAIPFMLLPRRWHFVIRPIVTVGLTLAAVFIMGFSTLFLFMAPFDPYPSPGRHSCGGPYVPNAAPCEAERWRQWIDESAQAYNRYTTWLLTPPPLRASCDWVSPVLCEKMRANSFVGSWREYGLLSIPLLLTAGLTFFTVDTLFMWRAGKKKKRPPIPLTESSAESSS